MEGKLRILKGQLKGELYFDNLMRTVYATDASAYREMPLAVAIPKDEDDIALLIKFAIRNNTSLIPRAAGTSLAGQVVGAGIIVDVSKYFTNIIEVNKDENWVRVQPGVIRDELNLYLKDYGLYFGPETSTANRAMLGGMVGNNSCGSNSLIYGSAREHTLEVKGFLSDGSFVHFKDLSFDEFIAKCQLESLEGAIYKHIKTTLSDYNIQEEIRNKFPKSTVKRRNTGYAIDMLLHSNPFTATDVPFNFCKLICGSEGTLVFITEIKLHVDSLPNKSSGLLCAHFNSIEDALKANLIVLNHQPLVSELMDSYILDCTKNNIAQNENRFFVEGDPAAILIVEYDGDDEKEILTKIEAVKTDLLKDNLGYYFPVIFGADKRKVWNLRKAGLGLLSNTPGDDKPVAVIEDTAVDVNDLPAFISEFNTILARYQLYSVHYAHAATGELHLRPILNLKTSNGNKLFREIAFEIAKLVKKYRGSLSGEHGDGRLRGEFIPFMIGERNYQLLKDIKYKWDPKGLFNPGKIVDTPAMNSFLRYEPDAPQKVFNTVFRYNGQNILQHAEQCNGSGDCRKTELAGGTMCPSYMATRNEKDTTRARANILREFLTNSTKDNPFNHQEIKEVMDLCLSCKGCKSECPSSVDMAKLKADFLQSYYDTNGIPLRARMLGHIDKITALAAHFPKLYNWTISNATTSKWLKQMIGFSVNRTLPSIADKSLRQWFNNREISVADARDQQYVYFFCDEFTNYNDVEIGKKAILLLEALGYTVLMVNHPASGRALISKGLLREAKKLANKNVQIFSALIHDNIALVAVEPSTILSFRDEYIDLVDEPLINDAKRIAKQAMVLEEFIWKEFERGNISSSKFRNTNLDLLLHAHCQQKAWNLHHFSEKVLTIPRGNKVTTIASGCCGMAGSFGYEKEHYDLSMKIGELVLLPAVRAKRKETVIVAPGSSCRHQIKDGTAENAMHPIEILFEALQ
ncbi:FAD-binding and (Fe-S)-binding domain-containing protein [Sphingobacterium rhinopitheci]|uniref:FAD-binding and (Fe-S)-binding domain-containing protein n=1 Tax=Sphingobacterium rhinopitheci TaxID=2781960 RepID=UPI001F5232A9|nr:FAD-binding and (Fe-S)-binding domain-containing protein [Sphingobacterium rhinopitheci]MCI0920479.1 FAD-binding protein [Sphingobacterium rhinopitheci]